MHLFCGDEPVASNTEVAREGDSIESHASSRYSERVAQLESDIVELRRELDTLREQFAAFQKQFQ